MAKMIDGQRVLFQKLGNIWYAFAEINNQMHFVEIPHEIDPRDASFDFFQVMDSAEIRTRNNKDFVETAA